MRYFHKILRAVIRVSLNPAISIVASPFLSRDNVKTLSWHFLVSAREALMTLIGSFYLLRPVSFLGKCISGIFSCSGFELSAL